MGRNKKYVGVVEHPPIYQVVLLHYRHNGSNRTKRGWYNHKGEYTIPAQWIWYVDHWAPHGFDSKSYDLVYKWEPVNSSDFTDTRGI